MPSVKVLYAVLFSCLVLYFLLYIFLVKKLPAMPKVKIYFGDEPPQTDMYSQQYIAHENSMDFEADEIAESNLSKSPPVQEFYFEGKEKPSMEISNENEQTAKRDIMSFLEGLGIPENKEKMPVAVTSSNASPLENTSGVSLRKLMKKFDEDFSLEANKPCPTSHLNEGMFRKLHSSLAFDATSLMFQSCFWSNRFHLRACTQYGLPRMADLLFHDIYLIIALIPIMIINRAYKR